MLVSHLRQMLQNPSLVEIRNVRLKTSFVAKKLEQKLLRAVVVAVVASDQLLVTLTRSKRNRS